ncbi:hypothetical protein GOV12_08115 [Candidatus Pacearchaeota archaeon]|nr:hypothetical protein [Candidatus Pacearchaeota archaeon]
MAESKKTILIILILVVVLFIITISVYFLLGKNKKPAINFEDCIEKGNPAMESYPRKCMDSFGNTYTEILELDDPQIGGNRDSFGCLSPAGYSWNESVGSCIREWELSEDDKKAVKVAIAPYSFHVTVVKVIAEKCLGCYKIKLQRNDNSDIIEIKLSDWKIINK